MTDETKAATASRNVLRVINWNEHFEGAKSMTYNNKTSCSMPTKHGLGYRRLIRSKNGPAMFGAWCALIQILSRHPKPRSGYLTDDGTADGKPYTAEDLELLTDIPAKIYTELLNLCASEGVHWVDVMTSRESVVDCQGTMVPQQGTILPLNSDLDSNLNSNSNSNDNSEAIASFERAWILYERKGSRKVALKYWMRISEKDRALIISKIPEYIAANPEERFRKDFQGWINPSNRLWENKVIPSPATNTAPALDIDKLLKDYK